MKKLILIGVVLLIGAAVVWAANPIPARFIAILVRVVDNEDTNENNVITFVANADTDGGTVSLESDGNFHYNPSTGTVTAPYFSGTASLSTQITVTDNESTNEWNAVTFAAGGDLDGGSLGIESDGDMVYNPGTGVFKATGLTDGTATLTGGAITGLTTALTVAQGGTGAPTLTDGGLLLGSGTSAITAMTVLEDGQFVVGDGTTDPVAESGATLRTSIGVGTGDSPQFTGIELGHASDTTITRSAAGKLAVEGNDAYVQTGNTYANVIDPNWTPMLAGENTATDAQRRTWKEDVRLDHVIDVRDYGAIGDGATDDTAAIQAAIDAVEVVNGVLLFPAGSTYVLASDVTIDKSIVIHGYGATIKSTGGGLDIDGAISDTIDANCVADIAEGDPNVVVDSEVGFSAGDLVLLYPGVNERKVANNYPSEVHQIRGVETNVLRFEEPVRWFHDVNESGDDDTPWVAYSLYSDPNVAVYAPISVKIKGLTFEGASGNYTSIYAEYVRGAEITDCIFHISGDRTAPGYWVSFKHCQDILFQGNRFTQDTDVNDLDIKGPLWQFCEDVRVIDNVIDYATGPNVFRFDRSYGIVFTGNICKKGRAGFVYFDSVKMGICSNNQIHNVPWSVFNRENLVTSQPGIFMNGVDGFICNNNIVVNCYGESAIYLRTGNYNRCQMGDLPATNEANWENTYLAPNRNIIISSNYVYNSDPNAQALGQRAFYSKSRGRDIILSNNIFECERPAVAFYGDYNDVSVLNNVMKVKTLGLYFTEDPDSSGLFPGNMTIRGNIIKRIGDSATNFISVYSYANCDIIIENNQMFAEDQTHDTHVISAYRYASGDIGSARLKIRNNLARCTSATSGVRGIVVGNFTGNPSEIGDFEISGNAFDIDGEKYNSTAKKYTGVSELIIEQLASAPGTTTDRLYNDSGVLYFDGVNLEAAGGDLKADGTVPLTANWDVGNYDLTCKALTGDGTIEGATLTEGGQAVPNATDHLGFFGGTTSAQLLDEISDETGTGKATFATAPTFTTSITITGANASPGANGTLVYDNVVAGLDDGAFAFYGGGDTIYHLVGTAEIPDDDDDDKVIAYDKDTDRWYMKTDADTGGSTAYDDIGDPDASGSISFDAAEQAEYTSAFTANDFMTIKGTGAFGDYSVLTVTQDTGNPTDGDLLDVRTADAEDDVDQLKLGNGTDDYMTIRVVEAGTVTFDVVSDGTPQTQWSDLVTFNAGATIATTTAFSFGANRIDNGSDLIDGEQIGNDTIDNDSIDWGDMTDLGTDGVVTWTNMTEGELTDQVITGGDIKNDTVDSDDYAADSIDNEHINWTDIDNLGDEGAVTLASTATALATARAIGGVNFDGTAAITPTTIVVADTEDATAFVGLWDSATGSLLPKTDEQLTYVANTGILTAAGFAGPLTGAVTGTASEATHVTVTDNEDQSEENEVPFIEDASGPGNVGLESDSGFTYNPSTGTLTAAEFSGGGGNLTGVDAATGDSATDFFDAGEIPDDRISNTLTSSTCTGTAAIATDVTITDNEAENEENEVAFVENASGPGNNGLESDSGFTYNPSTGMLTAAGFTGALTGNADTVTNATFTTALTVNTGTVTLTGHADNDSVLTIGKGASSVSGANTGDNTVATSGDAAVDFFGAGVDAVTDATECTDIEGTGLSIAGGTLNWAAASTDLSDTADLLYETELDDLSELTTQIGDVSTFITDDIMPDAGTDPDVDAAGELSVDTDGGNEPNSVTLRTFMGTDDQAVLADTQKPRQFTITEPDTLAQSTYLPVWKNNSGFTFVITAISGESDIDDFDFTLKERDADGGNVTTIEAVQLTTDGTSMYYGSVAFADIDHTAIEAGHTIGYVKSADDATYVQVAIEGYFNADVD